MESVAADVMKPQLVKSCDIHILVTCLVKVLFVCRKGDPHLTCLYIDDCMIGYLGAYGHNRVVRAITPDCVFLLSYRPPHPRH